MTGSAAGWKQLSRLFAVCEAEANTMSVPHVFRLQPVARTSAANRASLVDFPDGAEPQVPQWSGGEVRARAGAAEAVAVGRAGDLGTRRFCGRGAGGKRSN